MESLQDAPLSAVANNERHSLESVTAPNVGQDDTVPETPFERQLKLEEEMQSLGIERYRKRLLQARTEGRESGTKYGKRLFADAVEPVAQALLAFQAKADTGKGGRRCAAIVALKDIDAYTAAFCALRVILDTLSSAESTPRDYAIGIGTLIEEQLRMAFFEQQARPLFRAIAQDQLKVRKKSPARARVAIRAGMKAANIEWVGWPCKKKLAIGMALFEVVMEATGYVEVTSALVAMKTELRVQATPALMAWVNQCTDRGELMCPEFLPMVVKPEPWNGSYGGGYKSEYIRKVSFVKSRRRPYLEEIDLKIKNGEMNRVVSAVNSLQDTAWKINASVYAVAKELWDGASDCPVLANKDDIPLPPRPDDIRSDRDVRRTHAKACAPIHTQNRTQRSARWRVAKTLWIAEKFKGEPSVHFVYQTDFRGRVYPVNAFLQPQGADLAKGLLTFSKGKPIKDQLAADWLAIHGANLWGFDKVGLPERVEWVNENIEMIISCALQPLDDRRWMQADGGDKAWQFLAFCMEYNAFIEQGFGFLSSLPVALDGSCNGIQHFSALLLDPVGGRAVNLIPTDTPQDIYGEVAKVVIKRLQASDHRWAAWWLAFGVTRKTTKRPVMVLPYGGTKHSCLDFVRDWYKERRSQGATMILSQEDEGPACFWLGEQVWESIGEVVQVAQVAMRWLQSVAKAVSWYGLAITWTSPSGFPVRQEYHKTIKKSADLEIFGRRHQVLLDQETDEIDKIRQKNGIAPNFVHSLDAAAMCLTVVRLVGHGLTDFAMVHDSYGVHACDAQLLGSVLRNTFVRMYSEQDVMAAFRSEVGAYVDEVLPAVPPKGDLVLADIEKSDFFFA